METTFLYKKWVIKLFVYEKLVPKTECKALSFLLSSAFLFSFKVQFKTLNSNACFLSLTDLSKKDKWFQCTSLGCKYIPLSISFYKTLVGRIAWQSDRERQGQEKHDFGWKEVWEGKWFLFSYFLYSFQVKQDSLKLGLNVFLLYMYCMGNVSCLKISWVSDGKEFHV